MDRAALEGGPPDRRAASGTYHVPPPVLAECGTGPVVREKSKDLTVESREKAPLAPGQSGPVLDEWLEHGLGIERRAAYHLEHFAGRRLLLERHPQLVVARLQFLEQLDVLDGDDGLVGERLEARDPRPQKGRHPARAEGANDTDRHPLAEQG